MIGYNGCPNTIGWKDCINITVCMSQHNKTHNNIIQHNITHHNKTQYNTNRTEYITV